MLSLEIPAGTTIESLVTEFLPRLHSAAVQGQVPLEPLTISIQIDGRGSWTARIRGAAMEVTEGSAERPTLWVYATERSVEGFLEDAAGPRRLQPRFGPVGGVSTMSDPRVVKRVAMANGRVELAVTVDDGERLSIVFGFGAATRRSIDPEDADVVIESALTTLERVLHGKLAPEAALADGHVSVRGNRLLALQLALAVAPFYPVSR
jgi:putative sterol carrier protein